jgi:hypothetical protein
MSSAFQYSTTHAKDSGLFCKEEREGPNDPQPIDPPDNQGGGGAELPGEEILSDYADPPEN